MTLADVGLLVLRAVLGGIYIAHGARKLGWRNTRKFGGFRTSIGRRGFRPAWFWATAAVGAEIVGGGLAAIGLLTPLAGAMLLAQSVTIIALVRSRGLWVEEMGVEYPLVLATASLAVGLAGPGALSLDALLALDPDPLVRGGLAAAGVLGAIAGLVTRRPVPA